MGRPKSGELYRAKKTGQNWQFHKRGFGTVNTGTADRFRAEQIMKAAGGAAPEVPRVIAEQPADVDVRTPLAVLAASLPPAQGNAEWAARLQRPEESTPIEPLPTSGWERSVETAPPHTPAPFTFQPISRTPEVIGQHVASVAGDAKSAALANLKRKLTPAKREKLMAVLGGGLAKVNALAVELALGMSGRKLADDYVISDDDLEIIATGYQMGLDELLANADPEWWHLVLTGNLVLAVSILPHVERKTKIETETVPNGE